MLSRQKEFMRSMATLEQPLIIQAQTEFVILAFKIIMFSGLYSKASPGGGWSDRVH